MLPRTILLTGTLVLVEACSEGASDSATRAQAHDEGLDAGYVILGWDSGSRAEAREREPPAFVADAAQEAPQPPRAADAAPAAPDSRASEDAAADAAATADAAALDEGPAGQGEPDASSQQDPSGQGDTDVAPADGPSDTSDAAVAALVSDAGPRPVLDAGARERAQSAPVANDGGDAGPCELLLERCGKLDSDAGPVRDCYELGRSGDAPACSEQAAACRELCADARRDV